MNINNKVDLGGQKHRGKKAGNCYKMQSWEIAEPVFSITHNKTCWNSNIVLKPHNIIIMGLLRVI